MLGSYSCWESPGKRLLLCGPDSSKAEIITNKKDKPPLGGGFIYSGELLLDDLLYDLSDLLADIIGDLFAVAIATLFDLFAGILLAELVLENLGEQEVSTDCSGCSADHNTDDHKDLGVILLLLAEAKHERILL
jgi:hypothetical protein